MSKKFNVTFQITGRNQVKTFTAEIEFYKSKCFDYGNGYGMYIKSKLEPFGGQGYDIRYDSRFHPDRAEQYIREVYEERYDGENGAWKLVEISIDEAQEIGRQKCLSFFS